MEDQTVLLSCSVPLYCVSPTGLRQQEQETPDLTRLESITGVHHTVIFLESLQPTTQKVKEEGGKYPAKTQHLSNKVTALKRAALFALRAPRAFPFSL